MHYFSVLAPNFTSVYGTAIILIAIELGEFGFTFFNDFCTASNRARTRTLESRRTIGHNERNSCIFQNTRSSIAVEASSLRYVHYLKSQSEDALPRGWDDMEEEEDGT